MGEYSLTFDDNLMSANGGPWTYYNGLRAPASSDEWLSDLREAYAEATLLSHLPDGHVIQGEEHGLVIRQNAARRRVFEGDCLAIVGELLRRLAP